MLKSLIQIHIYVCENDAMAGLQFNSIRLEKQFLSTSTIKWAIDKSQQHQNKFSGMPELNPGRLGETGECYLCAMHWKSEVTQIF